jgi:tRNA U34 5-carboxymethylaminomethyl modifying GTPase MnmE/TrmE
MEPSYKESAAGDFLDKKKGSRKKARKEKEDKSTVESVIKEIENALFALKFYPVAVDEDSKNEALKKLEKIYKNGSETVKQMLLYMVHGHLAQSSEMKVMHTYEYFKLKHPNNDPSQLRMNVYRAMFNYNTSLEGLTELIRLLGRLNGSDDAAKLLTYHYSRFCIMENEATRTLRAAIIDALGKSESHYALKALMDYARYTDSEPTINRVVNALVEWEEKIDGLKISAKEKKKLREKLREFIAKEGKASHYG